MGRGACARQGLADGDGRRAHARAGGDWDHPLGLEPREFDLLVRSTAVNSTAHLRFADDDDGGLDVELDVIVDATVEAVSVVSSAPPSSTTSLPSSRAGTPWEPLGSRTECALLGLATALGGDYRRARAAGAVLAVTPFSSDAKAMATLVTRGGAGDSLDLALPSGGKGDAVVLAAAAADMAEAPLPAPASATSQPARIYYKGAAEVVVARCATRLTPGGGTAPLAPAASTALVADLAADGSRVIGLAYRDVLLGGGCPDAALAAGVEGDLTLVGLVGISDPLRPGVPAAVAACARAGVDVRMLTGDSPATAAAIARECGILPAGPAQPGAIVTGREFRAAVQPGGPDALPDVAAFWVLWPTLRVLARCSPRDKLTIVRCLHTNPDAIVAVTGDGVNDAPALRAADVGFAMAGGAPISRQAADILLLDNSFSSVVSALRWGRNVYASASKFLQFQLVVNVVAVATAVAGALSLGDSPLTAVQAGGWVWRGWWAGQAARQDGEEGGGGAVPARPPARPPAPPGSTHPTPPTPADVVGQPHHGFAGQPGAGDRRA